LEGVSSDASPSCLLLPLQSTSLNAFSRKQEGEAVVLFLQEGEAEPFQGSTASPS